MPGREQIDVARARYLYDQLGSWREVAIWLYRRTGQPFAADAISQAVRRADRIGAHPKLTVQPFAGAA
jgi:hypothetical protein